MKRQLRLLAGAALAALLSATPLFAGGEGEGTGGAAGAGAASAGMATEGEPYRDHIWPTVTAYTAATGKAIDSFSEAPALAALVASGDLPPLDQRLPPDPAVIRPVDEIGRYGGTFNSAGDGREAAPGAIVEGSSQLLTAYNPDISQIVPNLIIGWEQSNGDRTFTLHLRPGMKWSDGELFDADDFVFWMEAVGGDDRVFSRIRSRNVIWRGSLPSIEKVDQYTVAYTWPDAYSTAPLRMMATRPFHPEHYLAKFHIDFGDDAEELAKEGGYESWSQSFNDRSAERDGGGTRPVTLSANDIPMPVLDPWKLAEESPDSELWQRNPYYWKVDTAGNQLPYVDQVLVPMFPKPEEQVPVKLMAGELDFTSGLNLPDLPVYKRNEESGGYQIVLMENGSSATEFGYVLNYTHKDPVLREIFNDVRFRQALSLAIDRPDMSDTLFFGQSKPVVLNAPTHWTGYEAWMNEDFSDRDLDRANALLDEMGLEWDSDRKWRLRPDGKVLGFEGSWPAGWDASYEDGMELISSYWAEIGVNMTQKYTPEELQHERALANEIDSSFWPGGGGAEITARINYPVRLMPAWHWIHCCASTSAPWRIWYDSGGADGEKPDDPDMLRLFEVVRELQVAEYGSAGYEKLANELLTLNAKNLWHVATVSPKPRVMAFAERLGNVPRDYDDAVTVLGLVNTYAIDTWYIKE